MAIDHAEVGQVTLRLIDRIIEDYGQEAQLTNVMVIAEVMHESESDPGDIDTTVQWASLQTNPISNTGLVATVLRGLL